MSAPKEDVRFLITVERGKFDNDYMRLEAQFIRIEDGHVRNVTASSHGLADLKVTALARTVPDDGLPDTYAWGVSYREVFDIPLHRAEVMVRTLRRVERGLERLRQRSGSPESFASYLIRVGEVLGVTRYGVHGSPSTGWHDQNSYRWLGATEIQYWVDHRVREIREAVGVAA